jgi:SAM-dependent methyltransferase
MHVPEKSWFDKKRRERGRRALERQLDYQEKKAADLGGIEDDLVRTNFLRSQQVRRKLEDVKPIGPDDKILEVGSGAHGLVFGLGSKSGFGIDPLAVEYKRLFPKLQFNARTIAAIGERLPFGDGSFDVVLSDNVIDHAAEPLVIIDEIVRVLKPGGLLYFTVNVHHPIYGAASRIHGAWNAVGIKVELSAFADHTVHLTEAQIRSVFAKLPLKITEQSSTVAATRAAQRSAPAAGPDALLKKFFFKNALFELIAEKL